MNKTLYQLDTKGKVRVWHIRVEKVHESLSNIIIDAGLEGMKLVNTITSITEGKNIGKINETSVFEQAVKDAETELNKKLKKGYVEDKTQIKSKGETATINAPMKGYAYHPTGKDKALTLEKAQIKGKKVGLSRKLDGYRFRIVLNEKGVTFYSSSGDIVPSFPQIEEILIEKYNLLHKQPSGYMYISNSIDEIILDGEIYNHQLGFQKVSSACGTKVHITPEKQLLRDKMQFHLFDICLDLPYQQRQILLEYFYDNEVVLPVELFVIDELNEEIIEKYFEQFLSEGYEGLMIRQFDMPYEHKRTKQLLKYKPIIDEEFEIIDFTKSITGDTLGSVEFKMADGKIGRAVPKLDFGSDTIKQSMWDNKEEYIGKWATIEFLGYTDKGVPRHPRLKAIRKGKSID